jgi:hypothetical protein
LPSSRLAFHFPGILGVLDVMSVVFRGNMFGRQASKGLLYQIVFGFAAVYPLISDERASRGSLGGNACRNLRFVG